MQNPIDLIASLGVVPVIAIPNPKAVSSTVHRRCSPTRGAYANGIALLPPSHAESLCVPRLQIKKTVRDNDL